MSSDTAPRYVIVGGGLAAAKAVEGIRETDRSGPITLVAAEDHLPYERPPLSKQVLVGEEDEETAYPHPREWYAEQGVELRLGTRASAVDTAARVVTLAGGEQVPYDRLLLATGSSVRRLDVPGADLFDVLYLRTMDDCAALRARLVAGSSVVVVGGGWIGLEAAAAARAHGCEVTVVEPLPAPLHGVLGEQVGGWFADLHRRHGVDLRLGEEVSRLEPSADDPGQVGAVVLASGERLPADTVVVGIGVTPSTDLAEAAGLAVEGGIAVDEHLRASVDGVWAAGDVAAWDNPTLGYRVMVQHWANAHDGGLAAGRSMAGEDVTYDVVPFFYSDQYDAGLEYAGHVPKDVEAEVVLRGDPGTDEFMAFWVVPDRDGVRVLAGMHVNVWDTMDAVQALVRGRTVVDRARLADPEQSLDDLAGTGDAGDDGDAGDAGDDGDE